MRYTRWLHRLLWAACGVCLASAAVVIAISGDAQGGDGAPGHQALSAVFSAATLVVIALIWGWCALSMSRGADPLGRAPECHTMNFAPPAIGSYADPRHNASGFRKRHWQA